MTKLSNIVFLFVEVLNWELKNCIRFQSNPVNNNNI